MSTLLKMWSKLIIETIVAMVLVYDAGLFLHDVWFHFYLQVHLVTPETQVQWDLQDLPAHQDGREIQEQLDNRVMLRLKTWLVG